MGCPILNLAQSGSGWLFLRNVSVATWSSDRERIHSFRTRCAGWPGPHLQTNSTRALLLKTALIQPVVDEDRESNPLSEFLVLPNGSGQIHPCNWSHPLSMVILHIACRVLQLSPFIKSPVYYTLQGFFFDMFLLLSHEDQLD